MFELAKSVGQIKLDYTYLDPSKYSLYNCNNSDMLHFSRSHSMNLSLSHIKDLNHLNSVHTFTEFTDLVYCFLQLERPLHGLQSSAPVAGGRGRNREQPGHAPSQALVPRQCGGP